MDIRKVGVAGLVELHGDGILSSAQMSGDVVGVHLLGVGPGAGGAAPDENAVHPDFVAAVPSDEKLGVVGCLGQGEVGGRTEVQIDFVEIEGVIRADPAGGGGQGEGLLVHSVP